MVTVLSAWVIFSTLPAMIFVRLRWRRSATTACRGSIEPAAISGRKGWYVMYGSGSTTVTSASPLRSHFSSFQAV
jgi:hypothetical protein